MSTGGHTVLVIGAGIAGLAAAGALQAHGFGVTVLEARDRPGGRIWTDHSLGGPVDLGADLIHRGHGNPITALAQACHATTTPTDVDNALVVDAHGRPVSRPDAWRAFGQFARLLQRAKSLSRRLERDISIAEGLRRARRGRAGPADQRDLFNRVEVERVLDTAEELSRLSLFGWDEDKEFDGPDLLLPGGFGQIVMALARGVEIRLNHVVSHIAHDRHGIHAVTDNGVFTAEVAIVTVPLGVLKSGAVTFSPPLPRWKTQAIRRLGVGSLNKIALRFSEVSWPAGSHYVSYVSSKKGEYPDFLNQYRYTKLPILVGLVAGDFARALERKSDSEIAEESLRVLRTCFPGISPPMASKVTRWGHDPFARGAYAYLPVGVSYDELDALAAPVGGRLGFAGEATHRDYPTTVHGAYLSGLREARRVLQRGGA